MNEVLRQIERNQPLMWMVAAIITVAISIIVWAGYTYISGL